MKAAVSARGNRIPNTTARPRIWFSRVTRWPTSFLRAMISERTAWADKGLHMHGLEEAGAGQVRQTARVVAVGLVGRERLEGLIRLPAFDADHGEAEFVQPVKQDRRHSSGLEYDATTARRFRRIRRRSPLPSTPSCSRKSPRLRGRERKHASRPSRYRGQQNSPRRVSSPMTVPIVATFPEELPPITRC